MSDKETDFESLDAFFDAARRVPAEVSDATTARILADAHQVQAGFGAGGAVPDHAGIGRASGGWIGQFLAAIGGWPAMAGLATAGVAGLWIGAVPPAFVETLAEGIVASSDAAEDDLYLVDPLPGYALTEALGESQ